MSEAVKILFLSANPRDISRIRIDEEAREVDEKIQLGEFRDQLLLLPHFAVRPRDLAQTLMRHKPHVLHFSGHGSPTNGIVLEDDSGKTKLVATDALANLLSVIKDNLKVVVLNACFSAVQAEGIQKVVDFTIGMQKAIGDHSAVVFSAAFYQGLAFGRSVQESFSLGVAALMLEGIPESSTPILLSKTGADPAKAYLFSPRKSERGVVDEKPAQPSVGVNNVQRIEGSQITAGNNVKISNG